MFRNRELQARNGASKHGSHRPEILPDSGNEDNQSFVCGCTTALKGKLKSPWENSGLEIIAWSVRLRELEILAALGHPKFFFKFFRSDS